MRKSLITQKRLIGAVALAMLLATTSCTPWTIDYSDPHYQPGCFQDTLDSSQPDIWYSGDFNVIGNVILYEPGSNCTEPLSDDDSSWLGDHLWLTWAVDMKLAELGCQLYPDSSFYGVQGPIVLEWTDAPDNLWLCEVSAESPLYTPDCFRPLNNNVHFAVDVKYSGELGMGGSIETFEPGHLAGCSEPLPLADDDLTDGDLERFGAGVDPSRLVAVFATSIDMASRICTRRTGIIFSPGISTFPALPFFAELNDGTGFFEPLGIRWPAAPENLWLCMPADHPIENPR